MKFITTDSAPRHVTRSKVFVSSVLSFLSSVTTGSENTKKQRGLMCSRGAESNVQCKTEKHRKPEDKRFIAVKNV